MIDAKSVEWTEEQERVAIAVLEKIAYCQGQGRGFPGHVFEAHARSKKNISTELVLFNEQGEIYLVQRPSLIENPSEPYPDELHGPGVTHGVDESIEDTLKRLREREGVDFTDARLLDTLEEPQGVKRGRYLMLIFVARAAKTTNPKGKFYKIDEIPWDLVQITHRKTILPCAIEAWRNGEI